MFIFIFAGMLVVYESSRIGLTESFFVGGLSENVMFPAMSASSFIPRVIIAPDTECIPSAVGSAYTVSEPSSTWQCNVAVHDSTLCHDVVFSFSVELKSSCFFSVYGGQCEFFVADRSKLYQVNFTVSGVTCFSRSKRKNLKVRRSEERRVFLNQTVYLSCGVLRL